MKICVFNNKHKLDLEHEILYFDKDDLKLDTVFKIKAFNPDLIIEEEKNDGESIFTPLYKVFPKIPKAWWMIDAHCNLIDHIVYAKQFDYIFCAQSWFVPIVEREVKGKVFYLPLCHTQTLTEYEEMLKAPVEKDIEFSFIGNIRSIHVERRKYIEQLLAAFPDFFARQSSYKDTLGYLRRSLATFNCSLNNDLNFRVWEGVACGALVVTDEVTDIDSIHGLSKYLSLYDKLSPDWSEMNLRSESEGQEFIKNRHTLTHRMNQLIEMIGTGRQYDY